MKSYLYSEERNNIRYYHTYINIFCSSIFDYSYFNILIDALIRTKFSYSNHIFRINLPSVSLLG
ncbi:hypothetical protein CPJCM30710_33480 [Clostridium polyendosporum]|uniref:Uncharacterized protein n=1 Tax=Clostridium polyendosporum TaxID=69208 RepID=A0A919S2R9_9CLOT|nr:hypothetical protein CPJCM30710_33480 [Clostridium polyendosporum]